MFPVLERYAYLQAGSVGPLARGTIEAMQAAEQNGLREGRGSIAQFTRLVEEREALRAEIAALVGVSSDSVSLTASTTDGCNVVLAGLDLGPGDEIVTTTDEHFGLIGPLHASGARVVVVEPDTERIVEAVTPRTRLVAVSHVLWTTGAILPVHELAPGPDFRSSSTARSRSASSTSTREGSTTTRCPGRSGSAAPRGREHSSSPIPTRCASRARATSPSRATSRTGRIVAKDGAARFDPNLTPKASVAGLRAAISLDSGVGARARRGAWPSASEAHSPRPATTSWYPTSARRSCPGASPPTSRPTSSRGWPRRTSSSAIFRDGVSSVHRSAGGRTTTTSNGYSPAL